MAGCVAVSSAQAALSLLAPSGCTVRLLGHDRAREEGAGVAGRTTSVANVGQGHRGGPAALQMIAQAMPSQLSHTARDFAGDRLPPWQGKSA